MHNYACVIFNDTQYFIKDLIANEKTNKYEVLIKSIDWNESISNNYCSIYELLEFFDFHGNKDFNLKIIDNNNNTIQDITLENFKARVA